MIRQNSYTIDRNLLDYKLILGPEFIEFLTSLGLEHHWIDSGAGRARAMIDYVQDDFFSPQARVTALDSNTPEPHYLAELEKKFSSPGFRYLSGQRIENRHLDEVGCADLITDVYGPLQYSSTMDQVLERYATLLKPEGEIWTVQPVITFIYDRQNKEIRFQDWLKYVQGLTVHSVLSPHSGARELVLLRNEESIVIPKLALQSIYSGSPPLRKFTLLDS
ncbi:hypothetical protein ACFL27_25795 [candidate division CSSED10-310 bacterium]|uniref:Class I SAM-dependent methyltransferase n=1 Tax=candidate division CSSED10-310 bacterium TaxID=2855610 RepID=A0ABV6Z594_UNCC1